MDTSLTRVNAAELSTSQRIDQTELFFDIIVLACCGPHMPAMLYHLEGDLSRCNDPSALENCLVPLGPVAHISRTEKHVELVDQTLVSYTRLVAVTGSADKPADDWQHGKLPNGALLAIRDALHCDEIRSAVIPSTTHCDAKLSHLHYTTVVYSSPENVYGDNWLKDIDIAMPSGSASVGFCSSNSHLYQVQT